jgi:hypothetical protein
MTNDDLCRALRMISAMVVRVSEQSLEVCRSCDIHVVESQTTERRRHSRLVRESQWYRDATYSATRMCASGGAGHLTCSEVCRRVVELVAPDNGE